MLGGKAIASGGFGCVFNPSIKCNNNNNNNNTVSKLLKTDEAIKEWEHANKIKLYLTPGTNKYIILPDSICEPEDLKEEDKTELLSNCPNFAHDIQNNLSLFSSLQMLNGGISLLDYINKTNIDFHIFNKLNNSLIELLENAIVPFNENGLIHGDIKSGNILVNPETFECKLIDWGFASYFLDDSENKHKISLAYKDFFGRGVLFNNPPSNMLLMNPKLLIKKLMDFNRLNNYLNLTQKEENIFELIDGNNNVDDKIAKFFFEKITMLIGLNPSQKEQHDSQINCLSLINMPTIKLC